MPKDHPPLPFFCHLGHAGDQIPEMIKQRLPQDFQDDLKDQYLTPIITAINELDLPCLINPYSRYVMDPNRSRRDQHLDSLKRQVVYQKNAAGHPLYDPPLSASEIKARIETTYLPYHQTLSQALHKLHQIHSKILLLDIHSFPEDPELPEVILGDYFGKSAKPSTHQSFLNLLEKEGLTTGHNTPFPGGYITRRYGLISYCEVLQIEFNSRFLKTLSHHSQESITHNIDRFLQTLSKEFSRNH